MLARLSIFIVVLLSACGTHSNGTCSDTPGRGQLSKITASPGGTGTAVVCARVSDGNLMTDSLKLGTLTTFSLTGPTDGTPGSCDSNVVVFLADESPDADAYPVSGQWRAGGNRGRPRSR
jgi:hypothetical protein